MYIEEKIADLIIEKHDQLSEENLQSDEILEILSKDFNLTKNKINGIIFSSKNDNVNNQKEEKLNNEIENIYSIFGTPDEKQKRLIDGFSEYFKQKMLKYKLNYTNNSVELLIDGKKISFPKEQPYKKSMTWDDSMTLVNGTTGIKGVDTQLMDKILKIFNNNQIVIGLTDSDYWTTDEIVEETNKKGMFKMFKFSKIRKIYANVGYFKERDPFYNGRLKTALKSVLVINDI